MTQPSDPHSNGFTTEGEEIPLALLQRASPGERAALAMSLSAAAITRSRNELRRLNPDLTEEELGIKFVEFHYGRELADEVAAFLRQRRRNVDEGR